MAEKKKPTYFADEMCYTLTEAIAEVGNQEVKTNLESLVATIDTGDYVLIPKDQAKREALPEFGDE